MLDRNLQLLYLGDDGKSSVFSFVKLLAKHMFNVSARSFADLAFVPSFLVRVGMDARVFSRISRILWAFS